MPYIIFYFILYSSALLGQHQFLFHDLTMEKGLSNQAINCAFKDDKGFIWLGTSYGLNRYDGYQFEVFTAEKSGLATNRIEHILQDNNGQLWLIHPSGYWGAGGLTQIDIFDPITHKVQPVHHYLPNQLWNDYAKIHRVLIDSHKKIWVILKNGAVYRQQKNDFKLIYKHETTKPIGRVKIVDNGLWISSNDGANYIDNYAFVDSTGKKIHGAKEVPYLFLDAYSSEEVFFRKRLSLEHGFDLYGKQGNEVVFLLPSTWNGIRMLYGLSPFSKEIWGWAIDEMYPKNIYVFDLKGKYIKTIPYNFENEYNHVSPMLNIGVQSLKAELQWMSLPGVNQSFGFILAPTRFESILDKKSAEKQNRLHESRGIVPREDSLLYLLGNQCYLYNTKSKAMQKLPWERSPNFEVYVDEAQEYILYGKDNSNEIHIEDFNSKILKKILYFNKLPAIWDFYKAPDNSLYAACSKGIFCIPPRRDTLVFWEEDSKYPCLSKGNNYFFAPTPKGVWMASETGLYLIDFQNERILEHYHTKGDAQHYLPHDHIAHIHIDKAGLLWLASKGGGLIVLNPVTKKYQQFRTTEGLSHNILYAVYEDAHDALWLSSNYGIMRFNKKTFIVNEYHKRDGISHEEFNTTSHYQAPDGSIYFGGLNGFTYFQPEDFYKEENNASVPFQISKFVRHNDDQETTSDETALLLKDHVIVQNSDREEFILRFSLLNFIHTENNRYGYKIEGLDKNWNYIKEPQIQFHNLPYGHYTLLLKAQGKNGLWQEYPIPIQIRVPKPFYLQGWFILVVLGVLVVLIYWLIRWRVQQLEARKVELEKEIKNRTQEIVEDKAVIEQQTKILMQQAEELKGLDKAKNIFFANFSHELRTPLTLILSPTEALLYEKALDDARVRSVLQTIFSNGKHLLRLVEEILDLSKMDAQKLTVEPEPVLLLIFLQTITDNFLLQAQEKQMVFNVVTENFDEHLIVEIDKSKIEKIIYNLLSNAFKFTPQGGKIELLVKVENQKIQIEVSDTGVGIDPDNLPKIFDRFFQIQQEDQRVSRGTGIGLAFCKGLVELMEGQITVQSTVGKGSKFNVCIPFKNDTLSLKDTLETPIIATPNNNYLEGNFKIAIAEDHHDLRKFLVELLSVEFEVIAFENGKLLYDYLFQEAIPKVDLIISDLMMPEMDGFELLQKLKENIYWQNIPSIILTARTDERDKLNSLTIGVDDYLTKPFSATELLVRVRNLLRNHQQRIELATLPLIEDTKEDKEIAEPIELTQQNLQDQQWIKDIEQTILVNIQNTEFNLDWLAQEHFISKRQLQRRIQKITGLSYIDYLKELRLQKARQLVEDGVVSDLRVLAYQVGVKTPAYFAKAYKERFGKDIF